MRRINRRRTYRSGSYYKGRRNTSRGYRTTRSRRRSYRRNYRGR